MSSTNIDVDRKARRMEDHLPPKLARAVRHLAESSGWSVRHVMLALLVNAVGEQAEVRCDSILGQMFHECVHEMQGVVAEADPLIWLTESRP